MTEQFSLYGNPLRPADAQKAADWQQMFMRKFSYDPGERYDLSLVDNGAYKCVTLATGREWVRQTPASPTGDQ